MWERRFAQRWGRKDGLDDTLITRSCFVWTGRCVAALDDASREALSFCSWWLLSLGSGICCVDRSVGVWMDVWVDQLLPKRRIDVV
jgi:hypothetical protein